MFEQSATATSPNVKHLTDMKNYTIFEDQSSVTIIDQERNPGAVLT
jgi:hypothetical protein